MKIWKFTETYITNRFPMSYYLYIPIFSQLSRIVVKSGVLYAIWSKGVCVQYTRSYDTWSYRNENWRIGVKRHGESNGNIDFMWKQNFHKVSTAQTRISISRHSHVISTLESNYVLTPAYFQNQKLSPRIKFGEKKWERLN